MQGESVMNEIWKEYHEIYKNRKGALVKDGVVSSKDYNGILLFLKEANQRNVTSPEWDLAEWLNSNDEALTKSLWHRVAEWVYGISNTNKAEIAAFEGTKCLYEGENAKEKMREQLKKIAVINVNKADGTGTPTEEEINKRLDNAVTENDELLKKQIASVKPRIIICGNTYHYLKELYDLKKVVWYKGYVVADLGDNKKVLIIDTCHPGAHVSAIMSYYGTINIYQQSLKEGWQR